MKITLTSALLILLSTAGSMFAQNGKTTVTNPAVTAEFGSCAVDDANCMFSNRLRQDVAGSPYINGVDGVSAVFNLGSGSRDLTIGLNLSRRWTTFDFTNVTSSSGMPGVLVSGPVRSVQPYYNVLGAYYAKENCVPAADGSCTNDFVTRMNAGYLSFSGDSGAYALLWNPEATSRPVNSPSPTVHVNVHYRRDSGGEVFTITPIANASGQSIAGLERTVRKNVTSAGQYDMPFTLTVRPR